MGPRYAAETFLQRHPEAGSFQVTLFGSLAATGRGHLTDQAISSIFEPGKLVIHWKPEEELPLHPNGMRFEAYSPSGECLETWDVYSVGGGALRDGSERSGTNEVYDLHTMHEILGYCKDQGLALWEYVREREPAFGPPCRMPSSAVYIRRAFCRAG
jgi:L-serine dehydratase